MIQYLKKTEREKNQFFNSKVKHKICTCKLSVNPLLLSNTEIFILIILENSSFKSSLLLAIISRHLARLNNFALEN